jgi:hypothetical protein
VGLTGGEDRGGGGGACNAGSTTVSPASLEKRRSGGMPLRAAIVPWAWPLVSGRPAAVADPFTLGAVRGGGDGGTDAEETTTFGGSASTGMVAGVVCSVLGPSSPLSLGRSGDSTAFQRCRASSTASGDAM